MADPIKITRAEYEAKFGASAAPTPIPITRAEFEAKFGTGDESDSWSLRNEVLGAGNRAIEGALDLGTTAIRGAMPGLAPLMDLFGVDTAPAEGAKEALRLAQVYGDEKAQTTPGRIAEEIAYQAPSIAIPGGTVGQRALSAVGAGTGAGVAKEITDSPLVELALSLFGSTAPAAVNKVQRGVATARNALSETLEDSAGSLRERALGIQYGDRTKGLNRAAMFVDDAGNVVADPSLATSVDSPIQMQMQLLKRKGLLDEAPNEPDQLKLFLRGRKADVGDEIRMRVQEVDQAIGGKELLPDFAEARKFIAAQRESKQPALQKIFNEVVADYVSEPGGGVGKVVGFKEKLGPEMKFDQLTDQNKTLLMRRIYRDFQKLAEDAADTVLPAGSFRDLNKTYEALENLDRTVNKAVARKTPTFVDNLRGGSLPIGTLGGAVGLAAGDFGLGFGVAGTTALAKAALQTAEQRTPMKMATRYENAAERLATDVPEALGSGVTGRNAGLAALASDLFRSESDLGAPEEQPLPGDRGDRRNTESDRKSTTQPTRTRSEAQAESQLEQGAGQGRPSREQVAYSGDDSLFTDLFSTANVGPAMEDDLKPLVEAVIQQESAGNPKAVSNKGAQGLMQVMPATAKDIARQLGVDKYDLKDPETNRLFGTYYLKQMLDMFNGDVELALTAYHSGPGRVRELLERTGGKTLDDIIEYLGPVGQKYARQVLGRMDKQVTA